MSNIQHSSGEILLVDKPAGWTSFDVVAKIRGQLRRQLQSIHEERGFCTEVQHKEVSSSGQNRTFEYEEGATQTTDDVMRSEPSKTANLSGRLSWRCKCRVKVGHSGTLDPFATGLLIILIGKATKRQDEYMKQDKVYEATFTLGATSTTGDPEGEIKPSAVSHQPSEDEVKRCLEAFGGEIEQTPPIYSAIKINGQKAYDLARAGKQIELKARKVTIYDLNLIDYAWPELKVVAHVSSGTYIRSLAADIGEELKVGAYCSQLRRTKIGKYNISDASLLA